MSKSFIPVIFPKQRRGASLGEYGIVTGLIALAAIATIAPLGERISNTYQDVADAVGPDNVPPGVSDKPSEETDSPSGPPLPPGDVEGNDTTTMHLSLGENAQSDLEDGYDHDWFRVTIPHSAHVHVNAKEAPVDGIHYLNIDFRHLDGSRIDDKNGAGAVDLIVNEVPAGDYFVDVSSYRSNDFGGYELQVNLVDDIPHGNGPSSQAHWIKTPLPGKSLKKLTNKELHLRLPTPLLQCEWVRSISLENSAMQKSSLQMLRRWKIWKIYSPNHRKY